MSYENDSGVIPGVATQQPHNSGRQTESPARRSTSPPAPAPAFGFAGQARTIRAERGDGDAECSLYLNARVNRATSEAAAAARAWFVDDPSLDDIAAGSADAAALIAEIGLAPDELDAQCASGFRVQVWGGEGCVRMCRVVVAAAAPRPSRGEGACCVCRTRVGGFCAVVPCWSESITQRERN